MADGHIKISTAIDNSQAIQEFKEFEEAIEQNGSKASESMKQNLNKMRSDFDSLSEKYKKASENAKLFKDDIASLQNTLNLHASGKEILSPDDLKRVNKELAQAKRGFESSTESARKLEISMDSLRSKASDKASKLKDVSQKMRDVGNNAVRATAGAKSLGSSIGGGVKSMAKYALAVFSVRSAYILISKLARNVINENSAMGSQLRGQIEGITTVFSNLLAPAVQFVVNLVSSVVYYLGIVLKTLFGIDITTKKASKNTKGIAKGAKETNKELKRMLAGFDEVEKLSENTKDNMSGQGGQPVDNVAITKPDVSWINSIFEKLKADLDPFIKTISSINLEPLKGAFLNLGSAIDGVLNVLYDSFIRIMNESIGPFIALMTQEIVPAALNSIADAITMITPFFEWFLKELVEPFINWFLLDYLPSWYELLLSAFEGLKAAVEQVLKGFTDFWEFIKPMANWLGDKLVKAIDGVRESIEETTRKIKNNEDGFGDLFKTLGFVAGAFTAVKVASIVLGPAIGMLTGIISALGSTLGFVWGIFKVVAAFFAGAFSGNILAIIALIGLLITAFVGIITNGEQLWRDLQTIWSNIKGMFQGVIDFIVGIFTGDWEKAFKGLADAVTNAFAAVFNTVKFPINLLIDGVNGMISALNNIRIPDWVPFVGGKGINIGYIPRLQRGGIINRPMQAMIGDGGKEAVIPLENDTRALEQIASMIANMIDSGGTKIVQAVVDGRVLFEVVLDQFEKSKMSGGSYAI